MTLEKFRVTKYYKIHRMFTFRDYYYHNSTCPDQLTLLDCWMSHLSFSFSSTNPASSRHFRHSSTTVDDTFISLCLRSFRNRQDVTSECDYIIGTRSQRAKVTDNERSLLSYLNLKDVVWPVHKSIGRSHPQKIQVIREAWFSTSVLLLAMLQVTNIFVELKKFNAEQINSVLKNNKKLKSKTKQ